MERNFAAQFISHSSNKLILTAGRDGRIITNTSHSFPFDASNDAKNAAAKSRSSTKMTLASRTTQKFRD